MSLKDKKINYFDFGLYEATEMQWMIDLFEDIGIDNYTIHGFEPFPEYYQNVKSKYKNNDKVNIHNLAVSNKSGKLKLHLSKKGPEGHSLIKTKVNLHNDKHAVVDVVDISKWINENVHDIDSSFNIVRMNIEGSEINVFDSFISSGLYEKINIFSGSLADIYKIGLNKNEISNFLKRLNTHNIEVLYLCKDNSNGIKTIKNKIKDAKNKEIS